MLAIIIESDTSDSWDLFLDGIYAKSFDTALELANYCQLKYGVTPEFISL